MLRFPMRKCYQTAKICLLLVLVVALLSLFEHWRGGKRSARAQFADPVEEGYEREILEDEARIIPELGEGGVAAHLTGEDQRLGEESEKKLAMNVYLSDRISYNRTLNDYRNPACQRVVYDAELPSASVIIIFHNEPYSVVVRTIWSVINSARRDQPWYKQANFVDMQTGNTMNLGYKGQDPSSQIVYLKEIILVDDNSTLPELKGKLSHYVRTRLPPDLIRILRLPDRVGLTRARLAGARYSTGDVLIFLDAHCEPQPDWLRPLLHRIKESPHAVLTPIIDVIDSRNFYYSVQDSESFQVGGFTFMGHFTWIDVPEREKKRRGSDIAPTWSPTMAGGLFAINREYYWELGAYDEQMAGWGGENLEMSFRIWQCGGTLETIPCSRVGHVFRSFHPYGLPAHTDTHGINTARMAEVWMDEYAELFYIHRPDLRKNPKIGDVTHRKVLREKLQCKNFQWYLENIYPEKFVPVRDVIGYGRFSNPSSGLCLDTLQRSGAGVALGVYPCHSQLAATQYFSLSNTGQLRDEEMCAELHYTRDNEAGRQVVMVNCRGGPSSVSRGQKWSFLPQGSGGKLRHDESGLCLDAGTETGADVLAKSCNDEEGQKWIIDYTEENGFKAHSDEEPTEQEKRLLKLRGQRRISRSLLSFSPTVRRHGHKHHKRGKHSRKHKNKFIMKLSRTLMNGTEEHLEVDAYCKHRQLYPNNTFVRDLVTILNEKNIKVINNGRVFERNKVSPYHSTSSPSSPPSPRADHKEKAVPHFEHKEGHSKQKGHWPRKPVPVEVVTQLAPLAPRPRGQGAVPGRANKIIIEEFVQLTSTTEEPPKRSEKKRKHKRYRVTSPSPSPSPSPSETKEDLPQSNVVEKHDRNDDSVDDDWSQRQQKEEVEDTEPSAEDQPMVASSKETIGRDGQGDEPRANMPRIQPLRRSECTHTGTEHCAHTQTHAPSDTQNELEDNMEQQPHHSLHQSPAKSPSAPSLRAKAVSEKPVKVVVKSNLTFNFGNEFFDWKKRTSNDIADILGELAIPSNTPEPVELQAWIKLHGDSDSDGDGDRHRHRPRADVGKQLPVFSYVDSGPKISNELISTGRGVVSARDDEGSYSSSESSGD